MRDRVVCLIVEAERSSCACFCFGVVCVLIFSDFSSLFFLKRDFTNAAMREGSAFCKQVKRAIAITSAVPKCGVTETLVSEFDFSKRKQLRFPLLETV